MTLVSLLRKLITPVFQGSVITTQGQNDASNSADSDSAESETESDAEDIPAPVQAPSRYRSVWNEAKNIVNDESQISQYHPSQLSAGDWKEAIEELEKFVEREGRSQIQPQKAQWNSRYTTESIQDKSIVKERLSEVIRDTDFEDESIDCPKDGTTEEWLDAWARWRALSSPPDVEPENQPVTVLKGVGESTAAALEQAGYATLIDISGASADELLQAEGIGKKRTQSIRRQVVFRSVGEIPGIGEITQKRLNRIGVTTAAELVAVSIEDLTDIGGIGRGRAETLQARAGVWLPSFSDPPRAVCEQFKPPYDSLEEANNKLNEFEQTLRTVGDLGKTARTLSSSPLKTPKQEELVNLLSDKETSFAESGRKRPADEPTWSDVRAELESLTEEFEHPSIHKSVREQLDIGTLPSVTVDVKNVLNKETPSTAIERIHSVEGTLAEQSRFVELAETGSSLVAMAEESSINGTDALAESLTAQLQQVYEQLFETGNVDGLELIEQHADASHQAIDLAESYPDYPFEETIADLATIDDITEAKEGRLSTLSEILSVSKEALSVLETTDYDHPAVDQSHWQESIREAIENRYVKILGPIDEQLSRIEDGLWEYQHLSEYDWRGFEYLIGDLYRDKGYEVTVSQSGNDMGVDIWAEDDDTMTAIQVKHFQAGGTVGRGPLQKLVSTLAKGDADQAVVVTSSDFADTAERYAADFGTDLNLIDRKELLRQLSESTIPPQSQ